MALEVFRAIKLFVERAHAPLVKRINALESAPLNVKELSAAEKAEIVESLKPYIDSAHGKWALEFERNATDLMLKTIAAIPEPEPGKDGLSPENFSVEHKDGGRVIVYKLTAGGQEFISEHRTHMQIYRGVWKADGDYLIGDCVTFGGSSFVAERDNPGKPETSNCGFRLAVKRGRDAA